MGKAHVNRIKRAVQQYCAATGELNRKHGLRGRDFEILEIINGKKHCNQVFIAKELTLSKATVGVFLFRLERNNMITRAVAPLDTRSRNVELTPAGRAVLIELRSAYNKLHGAMFANRQALEAVLSDIEAALAVRAQ